MKKVMIIITAVLAVVLLLVLLTKLDIASPGGASPSGNNSGNTTPPDPAPEPIVKDGYVTPALWAKPEKMTVDGLVIVPDTTKSLFSYRIGMYHGKWYSFSDGSWTEDTDLFEVLENGQIHHLVPGAFPDEEDRPMGVISTRDYDYLRYFFMYADDEEHTLHEISEGSFYFTPTDMAKAKYTKALSKVPYGTELEIAIRDVDTFYPDLIERDIYVYCFGYIYEDRVLYNTGYALGYADALSGKSCAKQNNPVQKQGYYDGYSAGGGSVIYEDGMLELSYDMSIYYCDAQIYAYYKNRGMQNGQADKAANITYDLTRNFDQTLPNRKEVYLIAYAEGYRSGYTGSEIDPAKNYYLIKSGNSYVFQNNPAVAGNPASYPLTYVHCGLSLHLNVTDGIEFYCPSCNHAFRLVNGEVFSADYYLDSLSTDGRYLWSDSEIFDSDYQYMTTHCGVTFHINGNSDFTAICPVCGKLFRFRYVSGMEEHFEMEEIPSAYYLVADEMGEYSVTDTRPDGVDYIGSVQHCGVTIWLPFDVSDSFNFTCPVCKETLCIVDGGIV